LILLDSMIQVQQKAANHRFGSCIRHGREMFVLCSQNKRLRQPVSLRLV
jgi:hypothetical protein